MSHCSISKNCICIHYAWYLVGEHGSWDDIANGKDPGHGRLKLAVHLDAASVVHFDANLVQVELVRVGLAACGHNSHTTKMLFEQPLCYMHTNKNTW